MPILTVSADGTHLLRDGSFFPYVADTAWSVFADASEADWVLYLDRRRSQGFTSVAISILPILHDRTVHPDARQPFAVDAAGRFDLDAPDPAYFANAARMVEVAVDRGIIPTLVVLWCNYVPGSWGAELTGWAVLTAGQRRAYVSLVASTFGPLRPMLAISGDDPFTVPSSIEAYDQTRAQLRAEAPGCLLTTHTTPTAVLPDDYADALDFFVYQSGHDVDRQDRCHTLAAQYRDRQVRRPVINLEPAYEQHGYHRGGGRFSAADVRRACWWSVLGGANAGIGYGAHGVWQWFRPGGDFTARTSSLQPCAWPSALRFRGGDDIALLARLLTRHRLDRLDPDQGLLDLAHSEVGARVIAAGVRAAVSADGDLVAVYLPFTHELVLTRDLSGFALSGWDLEERVPIVPMVSPAGSGTLIAQADVCGDLLLIFERERP